MSSPQTDDATAGESASVPSWGGGPLSTVDRILIRSVLETTIDQLAIVGGTLPRTSNSDASAFPHPNVSNKSLDDILVQMNKTLQSKGSGGRLSSNESHLLALRRLSSETSYVRRVLEDTLDELSDFGTGRTLAESARRSESRRSEREGIARRERAAREEITELKSAIEEAGRRAGAGEREESLEVARLRDALLESRRSARGEEDFVAELQGVREGERTKRLEEEEHNMVVWREDLKRDIEHEQRVTLEIESWLSDRRAHLKSLHKHWTEKLLIDVAQKDKTLSDLTAAREADAARAAEKTARLAESTEFVRVETERREAERANRERVELEVRTAVRIQSWWRMMMVRKCLGPYRRKFKQKTSKQEAQEAASAAAAAAKGKKQK